MSTRTSWRTRTSWTTPSWHDEARRLYAEGLPPADIGRRLERHYDSVRHALRLNHPKDLRKNHMAKDSLYERRLTRYPKHMTTADLEARRQRILAVCRDWLDGGMHRSQLPQRIREVQTP